MNMKKWQIIPAVLASLCTALPVTAWLVGLPRSVIEPVQAAQDARGLAPPGLGPFEPLREPHFVPAVQANFLKDEDRVLGVSQNGIAKAYLAHVAAWHHITTDQLGKLPILVTW